MLKRIAILPLLATIACSSGATPTSGEDPGARLDVYAGPSQVTLVESAYSGFREATRLVVRDLATWERVWPVLNGRVEPMPPVIAPDFGEEIAVVAALGVRRSGGFAVHVDSVARHELGAVIYVTTITPGPTCITTGVMTSPVHAVRVPRIEGRVAWRVRSVVVACG